MSDDIKESKKEDKVEVKPVTKPVQVIKKDESVVKINFAEFKLDIPPAWYDAMKLYANVKHDMDEKPREEWNKIFEELKNRRIG
jgi:hypothetical protein